MVLSWLHIYFNQLHYYLYMMMNELTWNDNQNKNVNKTSNTGLFLIGLTG